MPGNFLTEHVSTGNATGNIATDNKADKQFESYFSMAIDDDDLLDCFIHLPASTGNPFVLGYDTIKVGDARLALLRNKKPQQFVEQLAPNTIIVCYYIPEPNAP